MLGILQSTEPSKGLLLCEFTSLMIDVGHVSVFWDCFSGGDWKFLMEKLQWWSDQGWVGKHLHPRAKENKGPLLSLLFSIYKALHLLLPLFCKHKACGFVALLPKCHGASCAWWGFKTTGLHSALASQGQLSLSNSSLYYLLGLLVSFLLAPSSGLGIWVLWLYHPEELAWVVQEHILVLILQ